LTEKLDVALQEGLANISSKNATITEMDQQINFFESQVKILEESELTNAQEILKLKDKYGMTVPSLETKLQTSQQIATKWQNDCEQVVASVISLNVDIDRLHKCSQEKETENSEMLQNFTRSESECRDWRTLYEGTKQDLDAQCTRNEQLLLMLQQEESLRHTERQHSAEIQNEVEYTKDALAASKDEQTRILNAFQATIDDLRAELVTLKTDHVLQIDTLTTKQTLRIEDLEEQLSTQTQNLTNAMDALNEQHALQMVVVQQTSRSLFHMCTYISISVSF